jgi:hypothetical protein
VTRQEERIRELVDLIALANGSNKVLALAGELKVLVDARKKRLRGNPPAGLTESHGGSGNASSSFRRRGATGAMSAMAIYRQLTPLVAHTSSRVVTSDHTPIRNAA